MSTFFVSIGVEEAIKLINERILGGITTGECINSYALASPHGGTCIVRVYEKYYFRAYARLTATVTVDDFEGKTRVHTVVGGGAGMIRGDFGASSSFSDTVYEALSPYII